MTLPHQPKLFLITGVMAAGKSTLAQALAEALPKSVHVRGDVFRRMIVNDRVEMSPDPTPEATRQLHLRYELSASACDQYLNAGFNVVYQDLLMGSILDVAIARLQEHSLRVVVLCPDTDTVLARERERDKTGYGTFSAAQMNEAFHVRTPRRGLWLDTSTLSVADTVRAILQREAEAVISHPDQPPEHR